MTTKILTMIMLLLIIVLSLFNENTGSMHRERDPNKLIGSFLPSLSVKSLSGEEFLLSSLHRQNELLIFFSTTCEHCLNELRFWNNASLTLHRSWDIRCISVNSAEETVEFLSAHSLKLPVVLAAHDDVREQFHINSVPSLFLIDTEGVISAYIAGSVNKEHLMKKLNGLIHTQTGSGLGK